MEDVKDAGENMEQEEVVEETPYLGTWKSKEEAEKGLENLQATLDRQGNELGMMRKQFEVSQQALNESRKPKEPEPQPTNYDKEIANIHKQMAALDPVEEGYQAQFLELLNKAEGLTAEKAVSTAAARFKEELDERDIKAAHSSFYDQNPDFNSPEMQARINEYLAKDRTGMSDPLVAYREIQRDDAVAAKAALEAETAELKRLLELKKGEEQVGKVITKGQSSQQKTKQPKVTGADLDKGMLEAVSRAKERESS